jgi:hypothetical protein
MADQDVVDPNEVSLDDFGPDDQEVEGTAEKTETPPVEKSDEKPEETVANDGVSSAEAVETPTDGPAEGQPKVEPKPDETPEDVKISRAYYQKKAQEETEARKALQSDLEAMSAELAASDPSVDFDAGLTFDEPAPTEAAAPTTPADEFADPTDIDPLKLRREVAGDVISALEAREAQKRQHEINVAYKKELQTVGAKFTEFVTKHKVPAEIANAAIAYSGRYVDTAALGAPTKRAELAGQYIQREMAKRAVEARRELAKKVEADADALKVQSAAELAQPAGGGVAAPPAATPEAINKALADDVAPDDPFD